MDRQMKISTGKVKSLIALLFVGGTVVVSQVSGQKKTDAR